MDEYHCFGIDKTLFEKYPDETEIIYVVRSFLCCVELYVLNYFLETLFPDVNSGSNEIFPKELLLRFYIECPCNLLSKQDTSESKGSSIITYARPIGKFRDVVYGHPSYTIWCLAQRYLTNLSFLSLPFSQKFKQVYSKIFLFCF